MNNSKIALGNAIGIPILFFFGASTLAIIPAILALVFGIKGLKQKKLVKKEKVFSIIGIVAGAGYILFTLLGLFLYYVVV